MPSLDWSKKQFELTYYINTPKMQSKLVYLKLYDPKEYLNKKSDTDNTSPIYDIDLENEVNVKSILSNEEMKDNILENTNTIPPFYTPKDENDDTLIF